MKQFLFIFSIILIILNALNAQPKFPLEIGTKWYIEQQFMGGGPSRNFFIEIERDTVLPDGLNYSILDSYDMDGKQIMQTYYRQDGNQVIEYPDKIILDYSWEDGDTADWSCCVTIGMIKFPAGKYPVSYNNGTFDIGEICFACNTATFNLNTGFDILDRYHCNHCAYYIVTGAIINGDTTGYYGPDSHLIKKFALHQNYPNPFNSTTKIEYSLPKESFVILKVYDVLGRQVTTLVNEEKPTGNYEVEFDGRGLSSGIYFYEIQAGNYSEIRKMILLK